MKQNYFFTWYPYIKTLFTIFMLILIPQYVMSYGIQNFLWLSDVGLFLTLLSLWTKSSLYISMAMIGIFPLELVWIVNFFMQSLFGYHLFDITDYMFDTHIPLITRLFSLFHIAVPLLWVWYIRNMGYNKQAILYMIPLVWMILLICYFITNPEENINWVHMPYKQQWTSINPISWVILLMTSACLIITSMHFVLTVFLAKKHV